MEHIYHAIINQIEDYCYQYGINFNHLVTQARDYHQGKQTSISAIKNVRDSGSTREGSLGAARNAIMAIHGGLHMGGAFNVLLNNKAAMMDSRFNQECGNGIYVWVHDNALCFSFLDETGNWAGVWHNYESALSAYRRYEP